MLHVRDSLVPDLVGIGLLEELEVGDTERGAAAMEMPDGTWLGFDPDHPHERLHIVLPERAREQNRIDMKDVARDRLHPIQELSEMTEGTHARYDLPNILGLPLGVLQAVIYFTEKSGDGPSSYKHAFGHEHSKGKKPILACDVSGRLWICGGSAKNPTPGITG